MSDTNPLTVTSLLAAVTDVLIKGGYERISSNILPSFWDSPHTRVFEDSYGIVGVVVYETWKSLSSNWMDAQSELVDLISKYITAGEEKAWDGYLVLLTPSLSSSQSEVTDIRYDTTRVRKIVSTGDELQSSADIERALLPLLPISEEIQVGEDETVLALLPKLLTEKGISSKATEEVVDAYLKQEPLLERLHNQRRDIDENRTT